MAVSNTLWPSRIGVLCNQCVLYLESVLHRLDYPSRYLDWACGVSGVHSRGVPAPFSASSARRDSDSGPILCFKRSTRLRLRPHSLLQALDATQSRA